MKKLIIVCEEKLRAYGDFLAQLISRKDDSADSIMGIKDGSAAAQVWSDKEYASNAAQISSEQYILFIGNTKMMKEKRIHMQRKFSEYGMNYGWLGKQGSRETCAPGLGRDPGSDPGTARVDPEPYGSRSADCIRRSQQR